MITTDVTIQGQGAQRRIARDTVGPPPAFRLFEVAVGARLRLQDVSIENGLVAGAAGAAGPNGDENTEPGGPGLPGGAADGGAIYSAGVLELVDALVKNNRAEGGRGGDGGQGLNGDGLARAAAAGGGWRAAGQCSRRKASFGPRERSSKITRQPEATAGPAERAPRPS